MPKSINTLTYADNICRQKWVKKFSRMILHITWAIFFCLCVTTKWTIHQMIYCWQWLLCCYIWEKECESLGSYRNRLTSHNSINFIITMLCHSASMFANKRHRPITAPDFWRYIIRFSNIFKNIFCWATFVGRQNLTNYSMTHERFFSSDSCRPIRSVSFHWLSVMPFMPVYMYHACTSLCSCLATVSSSCNKLIMVHLPHYCLGSYDQFDCYVWASLCNALPNINVVHIWTICTWRFWRIAQ